MHLKLIGAVLIVGCCGGYGMLLARGQRKDVFLLHQLLHVVETMQSELEFRLTPVPELCTVCAADTHEQLQGVFLQLAEQLDTQNATDASAAMEQVLQQKKLPTVTTQMLKMLGQSLGRFDLNGQIRGLRQCAKECQQKLDVLEYNQQQRLRSYQTLGFCAGAALAILLF